MAQLYIANLGKYVEGYLVGGWISLPFDEDEFAEFLEEVVEIDGVNYEEYAIHDTDDMPFEVGEYDNVLEVNEKYAEYEQAVLEHGEEIVDAIIGYFDFEEGMQILDGGEFIYWNGYSMTDVAYEMVDEYGLPNDADYYFDLEKFIRDLEYDDFFDEYMEDYGGEMKYHEKEEIAIELFECDPELVKNYFDYEAFGYSLDVNGTFIEAENGFVEILY